MKTDKNEQALALGIALTEDEEVTADTYEELTNGKGGDDNE